MLRGDRLPYRFREGRSDAGATSPGLSGETVWFCRIVVANEPEFVPNSLDEPGTVHAVEPAGFEAFLQSARDAGDHVCVWLLTALPWAK